MGLRNFQFSSSAGYWCGLGLDPLIAKFARRAAGRCWPSTVRETLKRVEAAGLGWPLLVEQTDAAREALLFANAGTRRSCLEFDGICEPYLRRRELLQELHRSLPLSRRAHLQSIGLDGLL